MKELRFIIGKTMYHCDKKQNKTVAHSVIEPGEVKLNRAMPGEECKYV